MWKKEKQQKHEQEKLYMARMQGLDIAVGEYVGDGQADVDSTEDDYEPVLLTSERCI